MFERLKKDKIEEFKPYEEREIEYEYPDGTVPLHKLDSGKYFYSFVIVNDKPVPSFLYRAVGKWLPSGRIAALGWATDEGNVENLTVFDPDRKVMPVVVDDIPTTRDIHIDDLVVDEEGMEIYRVAELLVDAKHELLGLRLDTPFDDYSGNHYIYRNILSKYRKVVSLRGAIRKWDGVVL